MFDTAMLMCRGRCLYHGSAKDIVPYFSSYGYYCEPYDNPADFTLDVFNRCWSEAGAYEKVK